MTRPEESEYPLYYKQYIDLVDTENAIKYLENQVMDLQVFVSDIEELENYTYLPNKWTIKEVIGHLTDAERVFGYRAMRFARGDESTLPGFDENSYVESAKFGRRELHDIVHELCMMRYANINLFRSFSHDELDKRGVANNSKISVRALIFAIGGHFTHHINVIKKLYLTSV